MDLNAFKEYFNQNDRFSVYNGIRLDTLEEGYALARMTVGAQSRNLMGTMHGGAYYTLADVAAGCAMIPYGKACVTLNADIHYMRPVSAGEVVAQARAVSCSGKIGVVRVEIQDEGEQPLCVCTVTMYRTEKPIEDFFEGGE
jgi:acyl-CoA thioesterase